MNETFKLFLMKRWTVLDDRIVLGKEEIMFKDITKIENELPTGGAGDGIVNLYAFGNKKYLYYPGKDVERANRAVDYVIDCINPNEPYEYRKKCNVCGFIFCYTRDDVRNNRKHLQQAEFAEGSALTHSLFVGQGTALQKKMEAEEARSKYHDLNRCPKCNSADLSDASEDETENSTENSNISSADELKKFKELLDSGIITQEEFDAKKKQLLGL